jgi:hypothetical protein
MWVRPAPVITWQVIHRRGRKLTGEAEGKLVLAGGPPRPEHFSGRVGFGPGSKKFLLFRAEKILLMTIPLDASGLNFRAELGLGRAARAFYSVKQLKTAFRAGLGPKKFFAGFKISAHARPVRFMGGPGAGRAQNAQV